MNLYKIARFQTSAAIYIRNRHFLVVARRYHIKIYGRFDKFYLSHFLGSRRMPGAGGFNLYVYPSTLTWHFA
jgi:hypothetical protein